MIHPFRFLNFFHCNQRPGKQLSYQGGDPGGSTTMKKIIAASFLAAFAVTMLLPVARTVNIGSVNHPISMQGSPPPPPPGGGH